MCGIAGLSLTHDHPAAKAVVNDMLLRIRHRGPDSDGYFASTPRPPGEGSVHLGFRRLAIRDLDPRANQPMLSASGRTAIVFNGEVYNSEDLAQRHLPDLARRTTGDTEVLLEAIERCGIEIVNEFNGMFGLAALDIPTGTLWLSRDRMGKKPIYLYEQPGLLAFGSELRCLKPFGLEPAPEMSELFLHFGYLPSPKTFYRDTTQVAPGEIVEVQAGRIQRRHHFHRFSNLNWSVAEPDLSRLGRLLSDSVRIRKISDVPLGSFLSGGVDSALVAAHLGTSQFPGTASDATDTPPTFTVAFSQAAHNESTAAAETAQALGLPHTVIPIEERELPNLAQDFFETYEQPYADTSGLVTMLLCRAVKEHVTVALSGDGGDEFFGGYVRYRWFQKALRAQAIPRFARQLIAFASRNLDARRGARVGRWLAAPDAASLYAEILRNWNATEPEELLDVPGQACRPHDLVREVFERVSADPLSQAACFDATHYIPDDLQVKLDRASMQVALEVRCPLLDYRVAELGAEISSHRKYRDGLKSVLKACLADHVPAQILDRPKHGFNVPLADWLSGPMRDTVHDTLQTRTFRELGWIQHATADRVWHTFLQGEKHQAHAVWMLLNLAHHAKSEVAHPTFRSLVDAMQHSRAA